VPLCLRERIRTVFWQRYPEMKRNLEQYASADNFKYIDYLNILMGNRHARDNSRCF
jgi:hypothetical protein